MLFWIVAALAALAAAAAIVAPLLRRGDAAAPRAAHDAQVFRDQLRELDRDVARGVVTPEDADTTRLEISRRLLAADEESRRASGAGAAPAALSSGLAALLILAAPGASLWLYMDHGAPGAGDQPFAARQDEGRPSQEEAERMMAGREQAPPAGPDAAEFERLVEQLETRLAEAPNDRQGVFLYARSLMNLGRFADAWPQFGRLIELDPKATAEVHAGHAEAMILAAGGYISPEAEAAILQTLKREPTNPSARYYLGRLHVQAGDPELAQAVWGELLAGSPPDAPWVAPIQAELAALRGPGDAPLPGPTEEEIAAASNLPQADQDAMARNMTASLAERLETEGGTVEEWQMLIRSYSHLNQPTEAQAALAAAREAFAGDPAAIAALEAGGAAAPARPSAAEGPADPSQRAALGDMIAGLRERLATQGGPPEDWLRLISSLSVIGRSEDARRIYQEAREVFADDPDAIAMFEAAVEGAPRAAAAPPDPALTRGPSQADIAAAAEMSPDERQEMIRGMVAGLHDRLRDEGRAADVNDWGRLMRTYRVLNEPDAIRDAYEEAIGIYDDDSIALAYLKEAALLNGVDLQ
ncbi:MAG: c-type cytochrome biogenesis protein CcmI [Pseudomonadota bacterium]